MVRFITNELDRICQFLDSSDVQYDFDGNGRVMVDDEDTANVEYLLDKHFVGYDVV